MLSKQEVVMLLATVLYEKRCRQLLYLLKETRDGVVDNSLTSIDTRRTFAREGEFN